jgi:hypothetical protein
MKIFLQHIIVELRNYSKRLDKESILIDKPWALIDSDLEIQKLIFKKNKELIMSKNGKVTVGKWDYLAEAKSLLIDRGRDKILCNEGFIDRGVLILKMDGTNNNFFVLANENIVPDLDVYTYLKKLRYRNLNIISRKLTDGKTLEIIIGENEYEGPKIGMNVTIEAEYVSDGIYKTEEWNRKYVVKNSMIASIIHEVTYKTKDGIEIMVEQKIQEYYLKGEKVWINEKQAENREYRVIGARNIVVKEGKILKKKMF